ncbi:uncharacterized protein LOC131630492 [Vicia villosa]|uniref:uncharacterized protein LOC131630492 n=1 Tax=Vicia villosa TaxID=3911 RepID=UPI00273AAD4C|nr:uncharacterized protein LOC131630492 [Vicia villosa]
MYWTEVKEKKVYVTRKMYMELRRDNPSVAWRKILFDNHARPRSLFTLWLALREKLPTKHRLKQFGFIDENVCSYCEDIESTNHLLFACKGTNHIWKEVLRWMHIQREPDCWSQEVRWMTTEANKKGWKTQILKIALAETVYEVWRYGNEKIFSNRNIDHLVGNKIKESILGRCLMSRKLQSHVNVSQSCIE